MPAPILIAKQEKYGAFTKIGSISLTASDTKIEITDVTGVKSSFDIPGSGLLSFRVSVAAETEGEGQNYSVDAQSSQTGTTAIYELTDRLTLRLKLQASVEPAGLTLNFIGEDEQDVMREMAGHSLVHNAEFGFRKGTSSIVLEVYQP
ncbi:MAG: hypothetical protein KDD06_09000 [Phaeodactylibacter sp.]|nr:hypothetical protein [Phaeodactylibacter sp.]MCB9267681.1 hypothetical protein [Lewinellaceae bacterium]MCB9287434.1 hypothetical protein [Lewinellaceae bacterium]